MATHAHTRSSPAQEHSSLQKCLHSLSADAKQTRLAALEELQVGLPSNLAALSVEALVMI